MANIVLVTPQLLRYEQACKAIAEAKITDEVLEIRNVADAMRAYAKQAKNRQLEIDAAEIRMRAERRVGELMAAQRETVGLHVGGGDGSNQHKRATGPKPDPVAPTLADAESAQ